MVKQINWSPLAKGELRSLLLSSVQRFGNKEQGKIIYSLFQNALHRITLNPSSDKPRKWITYDISLLVPTIRYSTATAF